MRTREALTLAALTALVASAAPARAQIQTTPCSISVQSQSVSCPASGDFYTGMTCYSGNVNSCPNADSLGFTYGVENATGTSLGTIVSFSGANGKDANEENENAFVRAYLPNYQVVQVVWDDDWELTSQLNIGYAAARPATFLNYIYQKYVQPIQQGTQNPLYGMCAQGISAGAGALGYALGWYGAASYLDKVELLSGPVFGNIQEGCEQPPPPIAIYVCGGSPSSCKLGSQPPWTNPPGYVGHPVNSLRQWTGGSSQSHSACQDTVNGTSSIADANWLAMSIASGGSNPTPMFNYPNTVATGWLCATTTGASMNNSSAQGWIFDSLVTAKSPYYFYAVQNCDGPEGVDGPDAYVPAILVGQQQTPEAGFTAIMNDMTSVQQTQTGVCQKYH